MSLEQAIRYDVEHDLFHPQNVFSDEYITPTFVEYVRKLEQKNNRLEAQIEKMKNCKNCKWQYCECSSAFIDKDTGKETRHYWNEEKEKYCDVGFEGKYQCWELKE